MSDGIWDDQELNRTAAEIGLSPGADSDMPDTVRFVRRVKEYVATVRARHVGVLTGPSVFILEPTPDQNLLNHVETEHPRLHVGAVNPAGRLMLCGSAVTRAQAVPLPHDSPEVIFPFVVDDLGLGDRPCVYYDVAADPPSIAWYPFGLSYADAVFEGPADSRPTVNLDDVLEVVENVHRTQLRTPRHQTADTTLWERADQYWAHANAERRVQSALLAGLGGHFSKPFFAEAEEVGDSGRYDLGVKERREPPDTTTVHALLELKVARSYTSSGTHQSANANDLTVSDGVQQVFAYAADKGAQHFACLWFDLRNDDDQEELVQAAERAANLGVPLRCWRCFPTAARLRDWMEARARAGLPPHDD